MIKRIAILLFLILCLCANALKPQSNSEKSAILDDGLQCGPPDFIIMINGKLPLAVHTIFTFDSAIYKDTIRYDFYYNFKDYSYGSVKYSKTLPDLCSIIPDSAQVYLEYHFRESTGWNQWKNHIYRDTLDWGTFYGVEFVNIHDINKKTYHINYILQPPWHRVLSYDKKKYGSYKRFFKKITRGWYPYYSIPKRPNGKSHPQFF